MKKILKEDPLGVMEIINSDTGEVLKRIIPNERVAKRVGKAKNKGEMIKSPTRPTSITDTRVVWPYTEAKAQSIIHLVTQGLSIQEISNLESYPPAPTIFYWSRKYPEFKKDLENARKGRAEYYHDQIHSLANQEYIPKHEVPWVKTKIDALKWLAKTNDSSRFGDKTEINGNKNSPITFVIETGIRSVCLHNLWDKMGKFKLTT